MPPTLSCAPTFFAVPVPANNEGVSVIAVPAYVDTTDVVVAGQLVSSIVNEVELDQEPGEAKVVAFIAGITTFFTVSGVHGLATIFAVMFIVLSAAKACCWQKKVSPKLIKIINLLFLANLNSISHSTINLFDFRDDIKK